MSPIRSRIGRLPWGLLGMLALVACGERYVARHTLNSTRPEYLDWRHTGQAARRKAPGRDVLILGTSMTQQGLLPSVVSERTGGTAYNLSVCAGQAPSTYFLLKRALDAGARPKAVLVDYHPHYLTRSYAEADSFWPDLLEPSEALDLAVEARDPSFLARTLLARSLPSVKDRLQLRKNILAALNGERVDIALSTMLFSHNKAVNQGAIVHPGNPAFRGEVAPTFARDFLPESWTPDRVNGRYVRRFLELARSRDVEVYWVIAPLSPELQRRRDRTGLDSPYTAFIREMQAEFANLTVLDASRSGYAVELFSDAAHLNRRGAEALSEAVGDSLASGRGADRRWVDLPAYRGRPSERKLLDLRDSQVAIRARLAPRR